MHAKKTNKTKLAVVLLAVVLLIGCTAGATLAWLMDSTPAVVNTFTYGDINIDLTETTGNDYTIIPGTEEAKDPKVTVKAKSEDCWVFVKIVEENNTAAADLDYVTWAIAADWTKLDGVEGVYYREYTTSATDTDYKVLANDKVTYSGELTKAMLNALDANGTANYPTLTFTAYAVQAEAATTAAEAWAIANP